MVAIACYALAARGVTFMALFAKMGRSGNMQTNLVANSSTRERHLRMSGARLESGQGAPIKALAYLGAALFGICFWALVFSLLF